MPQDSRNAKACSLPGCTNEAEGLILLAEQRAVRFCCEEHEVAYLMGLKRQARESAS